MGEFVGLSDREMECAKLSASGLSLKNVAGALNISVKTASTYLNRACRKMGIEYCQATIIHLFLARGILVNKFAPQGLKGAILFRRQLDLTEIMAEIKQRTCDRCGGRGTVLDTHAFGARLKREREAVGMTQRAIAKRIGVHPTILCDIENGRRPLNTKLIASYLEALGAN